MGTATSLRPLADRLRQRYGAALPVRLTNGDRQLIVSAETDEGFELEVALQTAAESVGDARVLPPSTSHLTLETGRRTQMWVLRGAGTDEQAIVRLRLGARADEANATELLRLVEEAIAP